MAGTEDLEEKKLSGSGGYAIAKLIVTRRNWSQSWGASNIPSKYRKVK